MIAILGFMLPLSAAAKVESLRLYLSPIEILQAYGTAWLLHLPLAILAALLAVIASLLLPPRMSARIPALALAGGFALAVYLGARPLLEIRLAGLLPPGGRLPGLWEALIATALGVALGWRRPEAATHSWTPALLLSAAGGVAAAFAIVVQAGASNAPVRPPARIGDDRPDILLITLDAFANDHLSSMGYGRPTTPMLDAIAQSGVQFTHLVSASNFTTPSLNSVMTGRHPWAHMANQLKSRPAAETLASGLPAQLHQAGYSLRAVSTNPAGGIYKNGYGPWFDSVATDRVPALNACSDGASRLLAFACVGTEIGIVEPIVGRLNSVLAWIGWWPVGRHFDPRIALSDAEALFRRPRDGRPVFLWVHLLPPHDPYLAPDGFLGRFDSSEAGRTYDGTRPAYQFAFASEPGRQQLLRARYDELIAATDADLGHFLAKMGNSGRLKRTVLIISADHGESFLPNYGGHGGPRLHGAITRVPLIMQGPMLPRGVRIDSPVQHVDLPATLLAIAGARQPAAWDGRSLLPLIGGKTAPPLPAFTMNLERSGRTGQFISGSVAVTDGRWKYVRYWGLPRIAGYRDLRDSLHDLNSDPLENIDIAAQEPVRAKEMRALIERHVQRSQLR